MDALLDALNDDQTAVEAAAALSQRLVEPAVVAALATHPRAQARVLAASAPAVDEAQLRTLAADPEPIVRVAVARRADLPIECWKALAADDVDAVVAGAATNQGVGPSHLATLVARARRSGVIGRALAANPNLAANTLARLAKHHRWDVRLAVAAHPSTAPATLEKLALDNVWAVLAQVAAAPVTPRRILEQFLGAEPAVQLALATNPVLDADLAGRLARRRDPWVAGLAARHPALAPETVRQLAGDLDRPPWVLRQLAINPSCPPELADELLTWLAIGGAGAGDPLFDPLTCEANPVDAAVEPWTFYRAEAGRWAAASTPHALWRVRLELANSRARLSIAVLWSLARDPLAIVRRVTVSQWNLPTDLLRELTGDPDPVVSSVASRKLSTSKAHPADPRPPLGPPRGRALAAIFGALIVLILVGIAMEPPWSRPPDQQSLHATAQFSVNVDSILADLRPVPDRSASFVLADAVLSAGPAPDDENWLVRFDARGVPVDVDWIDMITAESRRATVFARFHASPSESRVWRIHATSPPKAIIVSISHGGRSTRVSELPFPRS